MSRWVLERRLSPVIEATAFLARRGGKRRPVALCRMLSGALLCVLVGMSTAARADTHPESKRPVWSLSRKIHAAKSKPRGAFPNPYGAFPNPFTVKPNPYGAFPNPFTVKPNPYGAFFNPYTAKPNPH